MFVCLSLIRNSFFAKLSKDLFSNANYILLIIFRIFLLLALFNLISLIIYSFPVTTILTNDLRMAFFFWFSRIIIIFFRTRSTGNFLPGNSPWYLSSFLRVVEFIRIIVRPITLRFRLLANIRAGHILLSLICKMPYFSWLLGVLFGLLELMVSIVQSFVFFMLFIVYVEESFTH